MNKTKLELFKLKLTGINIPCEKDRLTQFEKYHALLLQWNQRTNLISRADESKIIDRHFLESIAILTSVDLKPNASILDVGSGAGFPGIPLAIVRQDLNFVLLESKRIKVLFLKEVVDQLGLKNVSVILERCEKLNELADYKNRFDYIFARAVARVDVLFGWIKNLLKSRGLFVVWKGGVVADEIADLIKNYNNDLVVELVQMDAQFVNSTSNRLYVIIKKR